MASCGTRGQNVRSNSPEAPRHQARETAHVVLPPLYKPKTSRRTQTTSQYPEIQVNTLLMVRGLQYHFTSSSQRGLNDCGPNNLTGNPSVADPVWTLEPLRRVKSERTQSTNLCFESSRKLSVSDRPGRPYKL